MKPILLLLISVLVLIGFGSIAYAFISISPESEYYYILAGRTGTFSSFEEYSAFLTEVNRVNGQLIIWPSGQAVVRAKASDNFAFGKREAWPQDKRFASFWLGCASLVFALLFFMPFIAEWIERKTKRGNWG